MPTRKILILVAVIALSATAQKKKDAPPPAPTVDVSKLEPGLYAMINTSVGTITAELFEKDTPKTVANFMGLARGTKPWVDPKTHKVVARPLYQNITFHRVVPQFMIQTGDPTATGMHDCGFFMQDEIVPKLKFDHAGRLAMANSGAPNTGACQFFITAAEANHLNNAHHTIFGQVLDGQELVAKIANVIRDSDDHPKIPTKLINITFVRIAPQAEPEPPKPN